MMQEGVDMVQDKEEPDSAVTPKGAKASGGGDGGRAQVVTPEVAQQAALRAELIPPLEKGRRYGNHYDDAVPVTDSPPSGPPSCLRPTSPPPPRDISKAPISGREVEHWVYQLNIDPEVMQKVR